MQVDVSGISIRGFPRSEIRRFVTKAFTAISEITTRTEQYSDVSIVFVSDRAIAALNDTYRNKSNPTDVLTFPGEDGPESNPLGDIVISATSARRQARDQNHSVPSECRYLLVHGLLHAMGYDHVTDSGEMNGIELKVRNRLRLR